MEPACTVTLAPAIATGVDLSVTRPLIVNTAAGGDDDVDDGITSDASLAHAHVRLENTTIVIASILRSIMTFLLDRVPSRRSFSRPQSSLHVSYGG
jgi:hypothetical protein